MYLGLGTLVIRENNKDDEISPNEPKHSSQKVLSRTRGEFQSSLSAPYLKPCVRLGKQPPNMLAAFYETNLKSGKYGSLFEVKFQY